jgi:hypothetical protein
MRSLTALLLAFAVSACSTGYTPIAQKPPPRASAPVVPQPRPTKPFRAPPAQSATGLNGVLGSQAEALIRRFGTARIDLQEGDARKLQFLGRACVLDVFFYPRAEGAEPLAAHVDARLRSNGSAVDRESCIREVEAARP